MGNRREPRKAVEVSVRIFGTDRGGRIFSEKMTTVDVSHNGAKVKGVKTDLKLDEIIGLTRGKSKVHFRVKWVGEAGSPSEGQIGLLNLTPEKPLWDFALPSGAVCFRLRKLCNFRRDARMNRSRTSLVVNHVGYLAVVAQGNRNHVVKPDSRFPGHFDCPAEHNIRLDKDAVDA